MKQREDLVWKNIIGSPGYQISNYGDCRGLPRKMIDKMNRTRSFDGRVLKKDVSRDGYIRFALYNNGIRKSMMAHRLVGLMFVVNPGNKPHINHLDSDRANNYYKNIEWCTPRENLIHSFKFGERSKEGYKHFIPTNAMSVIQKTLGGVEVKRWANGKQTEADGFNPSAIYRCCKNEKYYKTHKGFKWEYQSY